MTLANNAAGLIVYGVAYFELEPPYLCEYSLPQYVGHVPDTIATTTPSYVLDGQSELYDNLYRS